MAQWMCGLCEELADDSIGLSAKEVLGLLAAHETEIGCMWRLAKAYYPDICPVLGQLVRDTERMIRRGSERVVLSRQI